MYYVARLDNSPFVETPLPEKRILRALISPELDPTNQDIALGMTQMTPGCTLTCEVMTKVNSSSVWTARVPFILRGKKLN